ncbi:MAG: thioesterase family protein [Nitriliruptoraceae bacterium]
MTTTLHVRFSELDPYGHVNHAVHLQYFEQGRIEALAALGFGLLALQQRGFHLVVVEVHVRYLGPVVADDELDVVSAVHEVRPASARWRQQLRRGGDALATAEVRTAVTDRDGRPARAPDDFLAALRRLTSDAV